MNWKQKIQNRKNVDVKWVYISTLAAVLITSLLAPVFLSVVGKNGRVADIVGEYKLLNPARKLINQDDLIINIQPLRDELNKLEGKDGVSVYFEYLNTGANISINNDMKFWPASLLKVPVTMAVTKKIERGEWKWDNRLVLTANDKDEKFGNLYKEPIGSTFTIEDLVKLDLTESDNTANFILTRNLEVKDIEDVYTHIGLKDFISNTGEIGTKRYSAIFRALYNSTYLSEENSQKLLGYLSETEFGQYIKSGMLNDILFSHKIGIDTDKGIYLDSGIVYLPKRPYILTVMVKGYSQERAEEVMKKISKQALDYISEYREK